MFNILLIMPGVEFTKAGKWVKLHTIPNINEQIFFKGKAYSVAMVRHFVNDAALVPEYKKHAPFTRVVLMNL